MTENLVKSRVNCKKNKVFTPGLSKKNEKPGQPKYEKPHRGEPPTSMGSNPYLRLPV